MRKNKFFISFFLGVVLGGVSALILISQAQYKGKIEYFGRISTLASIGQVIKVDNKEFSQEIEKEIKNIFGGETGFLGAHYIKNESSLPQRVKIKAQVNPENLDPSPVSQIWQLIQITTDEEYKRSPFILKDKRGNLWLFFSQDKYSGQEGKGCDEKGVDCENHQYEVYYMVSQTKALSFSLPQKLPEIEGFYPKEVSALEDKEGKIWIFLSNSKNKNEVYYLIFDGKKFNPPEELEIVGDNVKRAFSVAKEELICLIYEDDEGIKLVWTQDLGNTWKGPFLIEERGTLPKGIFTEDGGLKIVWVDKETKKGIYLTDCQLKEDSVNCTSSLSYLVSGLSTADESPFLFEDSSSTFWLFWTVKEGEDKGEITKWINFATSTDLKNFSLPKTLVKRENRWNLEPLPFEIENQIFLVFASENNRYSSEGRVNANIWLGRLGEEMMFEILPEQKIGFDQGIIFRDDIAKGDYQILTTIEKY